jgi:hypothetical protein
VTNLLFLLAAIVVAAIGIGVLWMRSRSPRSVDSGVDGFARQMDALSPNRTTRDKRPRRG